MLELKRILLVEDSANDVALTLAALEEVHLANEVVVVRDGQQALDYLFRKGEYANRQDGHPAVVLLDLKLPKVDGLEVLEKVKGAPELKAVPVVMLTSSREERDLARSYGLGVNAYVVKPVAFPDFVSALRELGLFWAVVNQPPPGAPTPGASK
ncbi:response regulator [Corallococcus praedator]|uniref:Response regulator n=1 Tax=Corallococcus praedator TaxID=2316724 RepID=A0ABX9QAJ6_9BACT|nr:MULTISPECIES: response regulator [Corallococcus]RYZ42580.1 MAG: response regulator [Myxococcaceae bacterium]MCY1040935.1 response regulator [Corallococcus sp. bb12-1]RKH15634.1 response regulator [Corallococcus sp. CA047B]RKH21690.1 response regulator [Corallococcus sp. CA031C]RKH93967.1 response regulator [Corallococcus praedator]